jgi:hypothetical protein
MRTMLFTNGSVDVTGTRYSPLDLSGSYYTPSCFFLGNSNIAEAVDACRKHKLQQKAFSAKTKLWPKLRPRGNKTSARSLFLPKNFNFATHEHTKLEVFV